MGTSMESPGNSLGPQSLIRARTRMVLFDHDEEYEVITSPASKFVMNILL